MRVRKGHHTKKRHHTNKKFTFTKKCITNESFGIFGEQTRF